MAITSKMFGGFYRDLRMANLAWAESNKEGGHVELEMRDQLYMEVKI